MVQAVRTLSFLLTLICCQSLQQIDVSGLDLSAGAATSSTGKTADDTHVSGFGHSKIMRHMPQNAPRVAHRTAPSVVHPEKRTAPMSNLQHTEQHKALDCDTAEYTRGDIPPQDSQPKSMWWRVRMQQPCKGNSVEAVTKWDVSAVRFFKEKCNDVTDGQASLPIEKSWSSNPGEEDVQYNKQLAFDDAPDTHWRGVADKEGVWVAVAFNESTEVRCAQFDQCNCESSARWVELEFDSNYRNTWHPVDVQAMVNFGTTSKIDVKTFDAPTTLADATFTAANSAGGIAADGAGAGVNAAGKFQDNARQAFVGTSVIALLTSMNLMLNSAI